MTIPIIKINFSRIYSNELGKCLISSTSIFAPIKIIWNLNEFHIKGYELRNFIDLLDAQGYKLENEEIEFNFGKNINKQIKASNGLLSILFKYDSKFENFIEDKIKNVLLFFEEHDILEVLGYGNSYRTNSDVVKFLKLQDAKTNDYSIYEKLMNIFVDHDLNTTDFFNNFEVQTVNCTISVFNALDTVVNSLFALDSQDIEKDFYDSFSVNIIDDNSKDDVHNKLKDLKFRNIKSVSFIKNYSNLCQSKVLNQSWVNTNPDTSLQLSIDADILMQSNYLRNHLIRHNLYQNIATGSCRENSDDQNIKNFELLKENYRHLVPNYKSDSRYFKEYDESFLGGINSKFKSRPFEETNYFRDFGFSKRITGNIDLQMMFKGHNFMLPHECIRAANYAGTFYDIGSWGDEDGYMGRKFHVAGSFIVPVISTSVFHINHPPRLFNSIVNRDLSLKKNVEHRNRRLIDEGYYFHIN